jgi:thiosulfate/3-mercaptopyruvate sulfurtransferase
MPTVIDPFIDGDWLAAHRDEVVVADCRWYLDGRRGRDAYAGGHVPGAVFVDLETDLTREADPAAAGRHPLPAPEEFAAAIGALGIGDDDTVIAYDDAGGVIAARLVWMLRATGHRAALLDGGLAAWPGELETTTTVRDPTTFTARPWPADRLATIEDVAAASAAAKASESPGGAPSSVPSAAPQTSAAPPSAAPGPDEAATPEAAPAVPHLALIDARPRDRFEGAADAVDPRPGHIPGARSVPCRENLDDDGRLRPAGELRDRFAVDDATSVISYCGSGVTACHNLLAMEQAGLGTGRLFPGSWSQWSRDPARAAEAGAPGTP